LREESGDHVAAAYGELVEKRLLIQGRPARSLSRWIRYQWLDDEPWDEALNRPTEVADLQAKQMLTAGVQVLQHALDTHGYLGCCNHERKIARRQRLRELIDQVVDAAAALPRFSEVLSHGRQRSSATSRGKEGMQNPLFELLDGKTPQRPA